MFTVYILIDPLHSAASYEPTKERSSRTSSCNQMMWQRLLCCHMLRRWLAMEFERKANEPACLSTGSRVTLTSLAVGNHLQLSAASYWHMSVVVGFIVQRSQQEAGTATAVTMAAAEARHSAAAAALEAALTDNAALRKQLASAQRELGSLEAHQAALARDVGLHAGLARLAAQHQVWCCCLPTSFILAMMHGKQE